MPSYIRQFYHDMTARVRNNGETSDAFPVTNGVKQCCVLAPTLFSIMFSARLTNAFRDSEERILIRYRTDGELFNQRRLQAMTKVKETTIKDFLLADGCALSVTTEQKMQTSTDKLSGACDNFGLTISTPPQVMYISPFLESPTQNKNITVNGEVLKFLDKFTHLGSSLSRHATIDKEASIAFGRLQHNVWGCRETSLKTKLKVYQAVLVTTLERSYHLYACESWTVYSRHARQLNHLYTACLRQLLNIKGQERIPDTEILSRVNMSSVLYSPRGGTSKVGKAGAAHGGQAYPHFLAYGELVEGRSQVGRPKLLFKDYLKKTP